MPEMPDILLYVSALERLLGGRVLNSIQVTGPNLVRTVKPQVQAVQGRKIESIGRLGKRIVWSLEGDIHLVFHLMVGGRFQLPAKPDSRPPRTCLAAFRFAGATLWLVEGGTRKRASLHILDGKSALREHHRPGLNPLTASEREFAQVIKGSRHTIKRALTRPALIDGIGNAYSDEILHAARLSPLRLTTSLNDDEIARLYSAAGDTLKFWIDRLETQFSKRFPKPAEITAFRPDFVVHGKFERPCPACATPIARIRYKDNETNYCPRCQTDGRLLADRSLSRLLREDYPRDLD